MGSQALTPVALRMGGGVILGCKFAQAETVEEEGAVWLVHTLMSVTRHSLINVCSHAQVSHGGRELDRSED